MLKFVVIRMFIDIANDSLPLYHKQYWWYVLIPVEAHDNLESKLCGIIADKKTVGVENIIQLLICTLTNLIHISSNY